VRKRNTKKKRITTRAASRGKSAAVSKMRGYVGCESRRSQSKVRFQEKGERCESERNRQGGKKRKRETEEEKNTRKGSNGNAM